MTIDIQNIHPTKRTFGQLAIGDTFDFVDMSQPMFNSFYRRCVKISARKYQAIDEPRTIYRVGSVSAKVFHVDGKPSLLERCEMKFQKVQFDSESIDVQNKIVLDSTNCGSFLGPIASAYAYRTNLRKRLDQVFEAAQNSPNRFFVIDGETVIAAQSTLKGAMEYLTDLRTLVICE